MDQGVQGCRGFAPRSAILGHEACSLAPIAVVRTRAHWVLDSIVAQRSWGRSSNHLGLLRWQGSSPGRCSQLSWWLGVVVPGLQVECDSVRGWSPVGCLARWSIHASCLMTRLDVHLLEVSSWVQRILPTQTQAVGCTPRLSQIEELGQQVVGSQNLASSGLGSCASSQAFGSTGCLPGCGHWSWRLWAC